MYEAFFKLQSRPFLAAPQTNRYFPATVIENARKTLARCIDRGEGAGLIVGPSGTGKTLLCLLLAERFQSRFSIVLLSSGRLGTRQALLQAILYELGLPYRGMDEGELRLSLLDHLEPAAAGGEGLLLLIDEAHTLPWRLLEEVRMITNLVRDGQPRVRVVLAGSASLEERFASPKLNSFSQRLAARCYLESLDSAETLAYVQSQISAVGGDPAQIFHEDALRRVYRASDGIPRLINQVCDHALILASLGGLRCLTSEAIEEAWADLQQLPTPWNTAQVESDGGSQVVEFGGLDDAKYDMPEAIPFRAPAPQPLHVTGLEEPLDVIEDQLSKIDDAFQPAGTIGSEVELDFPEFGDPFSEHFAEEEVVLDRYSSDVEIFADVPRVSSWEGQQLGSMLHPLGQIPPRTSPTARQSAPPPTVQSQGAPHEGGRSPLPYFADSVTALTPAADPVMPEDLAVRELPVVASHQPPAGITQAMLGRGKAFTTGPASSVGDLEMIVIEDGVVGATAALHAPRPVRRLEYRQLFAKLRRG
ncbi:MAG: AAA family ATPase [Planctomycetia bacterium]|nr:AAA family ATPase [Planctomycetia bacterium]